MNLAVPPRSDAEAKQPNQTSSQSSANQLNQTPGQSFAAHPKILHTDISPYKCFPPPLLAESNLFLPSAKYLARWIITTNPFFYSYFFLSRPMHMRVVPLEKSGDDLTRQQCDIRWAVASRRHNLNRILSMDPKLSRPTVITALRDGPHLAFRTQNIQARSYRVRKCVAAGMNA